MAVCADRDIVILLAALKVPMVASYSLALAELHAAVLIQRVTSQFVEEITDLAE